MKIISCAIRNFKSKFVRFYHLTFSEKILLVKGLFYSIFILIGISLFSTRRIVCWFYTPQNIECTDIKCTTNFQKASTAMKRIIQIVFWPFDCVQKALVFKFLLKEFNIESNLVFSIKKTENRIVSAHVWLNIQNKYQYNKLSDFIDL